ncbi:hypothetical protein FQN54_005487 [Arachnomyces sp. PD_36]|nr:hypothetical protein FQN54_005487 [Arachnomyces sp. PD_36]
MRLYLTIQRHGLPVTRVLWTTAPAPGVNATTGSANSSFTSASSATLVSTRSPNAGFGATGGCTIAQLLEDVNEVVPLETDNEEEDVYGGQWGLEDYAVEIGGYECLHFMEVDGLLRDGDEVLIRALQTPDLKARRLTGRHQISVDGRHLIDGVPFGKPYYQRQVSSRPAISIPPRKRRRLAIGGWDAEAEDHDGEYTGADGEEIDDGTAGKELALINSESSSESSMDDYEEEFEGSDVEERQLSSGDEEEGGTSLVEELQMLKEESLQDVAPQHLQSPQSRKSSSIPASTPNTRRSDKIRKSATLSPSTTKSVRFQKPANIVEESPSDEETSESESEEDSGFDESEESDEEERSASVASSDSDQLSASSSSSCSASTTSSDSSDSESEAGKSSSPPVTLPSKKAKANKPPKISPAGYGSGPTKSNNRRGKMRRRLQKMKTLGLLHAEANFADLREWDAAHPGDPRLIIEEHGQKHKPETEDEQSSFEAKRQQLLQNLADGGVNVDQFTGKENVPPQQQDAGVGASTQSPKGSVSTPTGKLANSTPDTLSESASKRMKLDVAGSRRLLFGSLGVRTPKTKEDEENTRKKLAGKAKEISSQRSSVPDYDDGTGEHPDEYEGDLEDKLILRATECVHDDIPLSTPPFPFVQRWDEDAQAAIRERKGTKKSRKRKRNSRHIQEEQEEYDDTSYFNGDEGLNYDDNQDESAQQLVSESKERGVGAVTGDGNVPIEDDLPVLPGNLSEIPNFTKEDVKAGAIVAFKQLDMSKETNWQPKISEYYVAKIESVGDDTIELCLSQRHRKQRQIESDEDDGPRTYSKFEMPGYDDDENAEDDGIRWVTFEELIEPKLLQPGDDEFSLPSETVAETQDIDSDLMGSQENFRFEKSMVERARSGGLENLDEMEGEDGNESAVPSPAFLGIESSPPPDMGDEDSMDVDEDDHDEPLPEQNSDNATGCDDSLLGKATVPESTGNTTPKDPIASDHPKSVLPSDDGLHFINDDKNDSTFLPDDDENPATSSCPPSYQAPPVVEESILEDPHEEADAEKDHRGDGNAIQDVNDAPAPNQADQDQAKEGENQDGESDQGENEEQEDGDGESHGHDSPEGESQLPDSLDYLDSIPPQYDPLGSMDERPRSGASSTVTNPFPAEDSQNDPISFEDMFPASTAPPTRKVNSPKPSEDPRDQRRAFSSPQRAPALAPAPASRERDPSPELPPVDRGTNNASPKPEPEPSQAALGQAESSAFVDLTLDSDPIVSPGGSDDEFVESSGLPNGPGWVQKRTGGRRLRKRSSAGTTGYRQDDLSDISPPRPRRRGRPPKYSQ